MNHTMMIQKSHGHAVMLFVLAGTIASVEGASGRDGELPSSEAIDSVSWQIQGPDPKEQSDAIETIGQWIRADPIGSQRYLKTLLLSLVSAKRDDAVADLAQESILLSSTSLVTIEELQAMRIQSLLRVGKNGEALTQAKALFNLASMKTAGDALFLVRECLDAVHGNHDATELLEREQLAGADNGLTGAKLRSPTLDAIKTNSKPYERAIESLVGTDYESLCARGNLLLLAGRAQESRKTFEQAYTMAPEKKLAVAIENIARAMKAEDGTIGRANAWVLSIRPHDVASAGAPPEAEAPKLGGK